jgi:hypothetical protein
MVSLRLSGKLWSLSIYLLKGVNASLLVLRVFYAGMPSWVRLDPLDHRVHSSLSLCGELVSDCLVAS